MFLIYQLILYIQISPGTAPHPRKRSVFWALIVADRVSSKLKAVNSLFYLTIQALISLVMLALFLFHEPIKSINYI